MGFHPQIIMKYVLNIIINDYFSNINSLPEEAKDILSKENLCYNKSIDPEEKEFCLNEINIDELNEIQNKEGIINLKNPTNKIKYVKKQIKNDEIPIYFRPWRRSVAYPAKCPWVSQ